MSLFRVVSLLLIVGLMLALWLFYPRLDEPMIPLPLQGQSLQPQSVQDLERHFANLGYQWPVRDRMVPLVEVLELPADFSKIEDVARKKSLFLRLLVPLVLAENQQLLEQRQLAQRLLTDHSLLQPPFRGWLMGLLDKYKVVQPQERLLRRLDVLPPSLVLAQAAMESGWGTSRFALEGNSLFGQWTYAKTAALMPEDRDEGATHAVKAFPTLRLSVRAYLHNINTHRAYAELRQMRAQMRREAEALDASELAGGLRRYSQRGQDYVDEIREMLDSRWLQQAGRLTLRPVPAVSTGG